MEQHKTKIANKIAQQRWKWNECRRNKKTKEGARESCERITVKAKTNDTYRVGESNPMYPIFTYMVL